jgi:hypothetical protein
MWCQSTLKEGGLRGVKTSVNGRDEHVQGGNGTGTSGGSDPVCRDFLSDFLQFLVCEDEADVSLDVGQQTFVIGEFVEKPTDRTTNHGVLAEENDGVSTESLTDLMHLIRSDIVNASN